MKEKLKACPLCYSNKITIEKRQGFKILEILQNFYIIYCRNCSLTLVKDTKKEVIKIWNKRIGVNYD